MDRETLALAITEGSISISDALRAIEDAMAFTEEEVPERASAMFTNLETKIELAREQATRYEEIR